MIQDIKGSALTRLLLKQGHDSFAVYEFIFALCEKFPQIHDGTAIKIVNLYRIEIVEQSTAQKFWKEQSDFEIAFIDKYKYSFPFFALKRMATFMRSPVKAVNSRRAIRLGRFAHGDYHGNSVVLWCGYDGGSDTFFLREMSSPRRQHEI